MSNIDIRKNLAVVKEQIHAIADRCGRSADDIRLVAVSKTRSLDEVRQAVNAGQKDFGENTLQDALTKIPLLDDSESVWHFIGHLQSKKASHIPGNFHWIHSLDSLKLANKLSNAMLRSELNYNLNCLIQVNMSGEESKSGLKSDEVLPFIDKLLKLELPCLNWRGLMTIGVLDDDARTRMAFTGLRQLRDQCRDEFALGDFDQLSMGMSNDYSMAIEEGSTLLRIGTAIFGQRNPQ